MSRTGRITAFFAGEEHEFLLAWGEIMELQERREAGPGWIQVKLMSNQWHGEDVVDVIRLGLIGAGMEPVKAAKLVTLHVKGRPHDMGGPDGLVILALKIVTAAIQGAPDELPGKSGETPNGSTISPTERSGSGPSSAALS